MNTLHRLLAGAAIALVATVAAQAETVERSLKVDPRGEVEIANVAGTVRVTGWDRAEVQVSADLGGSRDRLEFERDGEHTIVRIVTPSHMNESGTDLLVRMPRESRLTLQTVSADQTIEDVRGAQRLQTVSGDIRTQVWSGEFDAKTVSGEIVAKGQAPAAAGKDGAHSHVRVTSVSGDVELTNVGDDFDLSTVSGDLSVRATGVTRARVKTTNGTVRIAGPFAPDARFEAESINGDVSVNFENSVDADFDIETFNGRIDNCFGPHPKRKHEYGPGNELRFKEGEGRGYVRIKTLNGKVDLCRNQRSSWRRTPESKTSVLLG